MDDGNVLHNKSELWRVCPLWSENLSDLLAGNPITALSDDGKFELFYKEIAQVIIAMLKIIIFSNHHIKHVKYESSVLSNCIIDDNQWKTQLYV